MSHMILELAPIMNSGDAAYAQGDIDESENENGNK